MKIKYLIGDATSPIRMGEDIKIIAHICNDAGGWGRGFVVALSSKWPVEKGSSSPEACYRNWTKKKWHGKPFVLGQIQTIWVESNIYVCNMIAQRDYKPLEEMGTPLNIPNVNYSSLYECLLRLSKEVNSYKFFSLHMPRIGAGLGGGSWPKIEGIINQIFEKTDIPVYVYDLELVKGTNYEK